MLDESELAGQTAQLLVVVRQLPVGELRSGQCKAQIQLSLIKQRIAAQLQRAIYQLASGLGDAWIWIRAAASPILNRYVALRVLL